MYSVSITGFFKIVMSDEGVLKLRKFAPIETPNSLLFSNSSNINTEIQQNNQVNNTEEINS